MNDNQLLMLNKFAEADDKAEKKFDALMNAFNQTRIDTSIPSHHCPTLTSTMKDPPMSSVGAASTIATDATASTTQSVSKKVAAKAAPAKGKPHVNKNQFVVPQHYVAKNPYAKKPSPTKEQSDDDWMLEILDEE